MSELDVIVRESAALRCEGAAFLLAAPALLYCDEKLLNTSGPSNTVMPDGSILYLRTVGNHDHIRAWLKENT